MIYIFLIGLFVTIGLPLLILLIAFAVAYRSISYKDNEDDF